ncbi:MAG: hypothetical protein K8T89_09190 [Planctomycetes bacterium]|nr:hypothetical protein [Planctomycetota bacterium]
MAKRAKGGVNKSAAIRDVYQQNPEFKVSEVVAALKASGLIVAPNLVYLIKGKLKGEKTRRRKVTRDAVQMASTSGSADPLQTIIRVKALAADVGGLGKLRALVDALSA